MTAIPDVIIEQGVPLPDNYPLGGPASIYPIGKMLIGDSFLVPKHIKDAISARTTIYAVAKRCGRRVTTRMTPEGLRVWRIE